MNLFHDNIYKDVAQDDFAVAEVINKCGIEYVAALVAGGIPMSARDPVGQFDRLTGFGYRPDLVEGRYKL